jgi:Transmembrane amino acid transporter protein
MPVGVAFTASGCAAVPCVDTTRAGKQCSTRSAACAAQSSASTRAHADLQAVAVCNTYTCQLLLNAALATHTSSFEELAYAIGGTPFQAFAQASNIILLVGNITGDLCLLADLGSKLLARTWGAGAPALLVAHHGRGVMVALTAAVIFPLSLSRSLHALENAAKAGLFVILALFVVLTADAVSYGFEGVTSGEVPLCTLNWHSGHIAEAVRHHPLGLGFANRAEPGLAACVHACYVTLLMCASSS